tara:strand:- start:412 stop:768 length:357 start_codon:yes stop_codon:yes gene_type:complete
MKIKIKDKPRSFYPTGNKEIMIKDMGEIELIADELITFVNSSGKRYDFVSKNWGFYATPSINSRLKNEGYKTALVKNSNGQVYIMVVDNEKLDFFQKYCEMDKQEVLEWLDEKFEIKQ